jgi:hypothetical protein
MNCSETTSGISSRVLPAETASVLSAVEMYGALGRSEPERAWWRFNEECNWMAPMVDGSQAPEGPGDVSGRRVAGGYRVDGAWRVAAAACERAWLIVRACLRTREAPRPEPYLMAVHRKQWQWTGGTGGDGGEREGLLVDAFVPEGLVTPAAARAVRASRRAEAALVGGVSLALGIAGAALERVTSDLAVGELDPREHAGSLLLEQQFMDFQLALIDVAQRLRLAAARCDRVPPGDDGGPARRELVQAMHDAAAVSRHVSTAAHEFAAQCGVRTVARSLERLMAGAVPALQHARFAGEFLAAVVPVGR